MRIWIRLSGDAPELGLGEAAALCEARAGGGALDEYAPPAAVLDCGDYVDLAALGGFISESGPLLWKGPAEALVESLRREGWGFEEAKADAEGFGEEGNRRAVEALAGALERGGSTINVRRPRVVVKAFRVGGVAYVAAVRDLGPKWAAREPTRRPFRSPSMLKPKLARALVNLSRPSPSCRILDPFSGTGSVLMEAQEVGCYAVGVELDARSAAGSALNMRWAGGFRWGVVEGDARSLPVGRVDGVATDLPYGRLSSTRGSTTDELLRWLIEELPGLFRGRGYASVMVRESVAEVESERAQVVERYFYRAHDSLTRKILVYRVNPNG